MAAWDAKPDLSINGIFYDNNEDESTYLECGNIIDALGLFLTAKELYYWLSGIILC